MKKNKTNWPKVHSMEHHLFSLKHTGPTTGHLKRLGRLGNKSVRCVQLRWKLLWSHGQQLLAVRAIGYSDWLCASESAWCVWGAEYCVSRRTLWHVLCFSMHSVPSFPVLVFWITCTRPAPRDVKEDYCISRNRKSTRYCVVGSGGRMSQCNFSAEQVRREATQWSDKGSWLLVWVWAVCGGRHGLN